MTGSLNFQERVSFTLRSLYERHGYARYKMSKFEEYDLYARNKDFLADPRAITFLDTNGKLMALKPDVTLSIVKNSRYDTDALQKLYYNESVYRVSKSTRGFRELMQVGLECLGDIDDHCVFEVLTLAAESLGAISGDWVLDISHLGLLEALMDTLGIPAARREEFLGFMGQKNLHELMALCQCWGIPGGAEILKQAVGLSGPLAEVLPALQALFPDAAPVAQLQRTAEALDPGIRDRIRFDFSVVDNIHYYSGILCKGFIRGLPGSVLSGGQYDKLMEKMGRSAGAIGFAVYMDALERLDARREDYDVDTVVLYDDTTPLPEIRDLVRELTAQGERVLVQRSLPENLRCRRIIHL